MPEKNSLIPTGKIQESILLIRGEKVIIDADLATFYGVPTKRLNEQVKRNKDRFPKDFMLRLTKEEKEEVVANCDHLEKLKFSKVLPHAFTEHGAVMAATVLNAPRAVEISIFIVRAFVALRRSITEYKDLAGRMAELERGLKKRDNQIISIIQAIKQLTSPKPVPKKQQIGFRPPK